MAETEAFADTDGDLERKIELLAQEPTGEDLKPFDLMMLAVTGIVAPTLLLLWGWA